MFYRQQRYNPRRGNPAYMAAAGLGGQVGKMFFTSVAKEGAKQAGKQAFRASRSAWKAAVSSAGGAAPLKSRASRKQKKPKQRVKNVNKAVASLRKQVKDLKLSENASLATKTYRKIDSWKALAGTNVLGVTSMTGSSATSLETSMTDLRFYDPAVPGTLKSVNFASGTFQRNILVKLQRSKILARNNYQSDCKLTIYLCRPKDDTSISPTQAWTNGCAKNPISISQSTLNQYPTDYDFFNDLWSVKRMVHTVLSPGQSIEASHQETNFEYDPTNYDDHSLLYQREYRSFVWLVVVQGVLSHDTTVATEQGLAAAGVDLKTDTTTVLEYEAGVNMKYVEVDDNLNSFTNGAVQSHQPIPDNIGYSVS